MEIHAADSALVRHLVQVGTTLPRLTLVDIGCSGGIHPLWRQFGELLRALAIDPNIGEIERLQKDESLPNIKYLAAFAGLPPGHPFLQRRAQQVGGRSPWDRLSVARSLAIKREQELSTGEKTAANIWHDTELADVAQTLVAPDYLRSHGYNKVDFLKIDVDGEDFAILHSFADALAELKVLGVSIEVNFFGSESETDHTFHNVDRFLKQRGFELFDMSLRRYSVAALPSKYVYHLPAATEFGRLLQGDALYFRDPCGLTAPPGLTLDKESLFNLLCLFSIFGLPDCSAELALRFREELEAFCDVDCILDLLAEQAQDNSPEQLSYKDLLQAFDNQDPMFFRPGP